MRTTVNKLRCDFEQIILDYCKEKIPQWKSEAVSEHIIQWTNEKGQNTNNYLSTKGYTEN